MLVLLLLSTLAGCAAGPNPSKAVAGEHGEIAGFWLGLWQGFIAPFVFVASLFKADLNVYEVHNNGVWYNFGYLFGLACFFGVAATGHRDGAVGQDWRGRNNRHQSPSQSAAIQKRLDPADIVTRWSPGPSGQHAVPRGQVGCGRIHRFARPRRRALWRQGVCARTRRTQKRIACYSQSSNRASHN